MIPVYIGLGANLAEPVKQITAAKDALAELPQSQLIACSPLYSSKPMGPQDQPDYVNAVALIHTQLSAEALLDQLQRIELERGRVRKADRWGPRTLDLDMLLYGDHTINTPRLTVPHYGMHQREFVLYPLADLTPNLVLPDGRALSTLLSQVPLNNMEKLDSQ